MPLKIAHLKQQGIDLIIVPLAPSFGREFQTTQESIVSSIQARAIAAGLAGTVVPVWDDNGRMGFRAPIPWHPFFRGVNLPLVYANLNRQIN